MAQDNELVIAIDGPSGAGKSSTARGVATRLGLDYLDTGAMYRAMSWACLVGGIDMTSPEAMLERAGNADLRMVLDPADPRVVVDGHDVTAAIREPVIAEQVSAVAGVIPIRELLTARMRRIIADSARIVAEGRDVTTVVWPQAQLRLLMVADPAARIARREAELAGAAGHERVVSSIVDRDRKDSAVSQFETPAEGVRLLDTTHLGLDEVIGTVIAMVPGATS
ncbi:(d)CMP kinase [Propionibacterium australiense]|uniref:Cytidylate kinase n=1 Tax=Propionibacterium australiense TaxID=119981 RepID=A0A383S352_9ACTN|nr:(d)CMP kinase [Propionibacterium australiense]RLP11569.1 (d)CMP kinase [Propionibacterium australiense]RLP12697.1 (d)CMP kinase [Propionibacterium australiense]SYZ32283.1 (d)CMP kinase/UMP/CMP kinase [Propionibacterium australiense]VEH90519.1 Cytidylate kinase [Propionibacterium australiense]